MFRGEHSRLATGALFGEAGGDEYQGQSLVAVPAWLPVASALAALRQEGATHSSAGAFNWLIGL